MELTQEYLKSILWYDKDTGDFWWVDDRRNGRGGKKAGWVCTFNGKKYIRIAINGKNYFAHRLAILFITGSFPFKGYQTDHIDGNGLNNEWCNLRPVTRSDNQRNRKINKNNKTGQPGVYFDKSCSKYVAQIYTNSKREYLGVYTDMEDAIAARKEAESRLGYHPNHGSNRPLQAQINYWRYECERVSQDNYAI